MNQSNTPGRGFMYFHANPSPQNQNTKPPALDDTSDFLALTKTENPVNYNTSEQLPRYRPPRWPYNQKSNNTSTPRRSFNQSVSPNNTSNNSSFTGNQSSFNESGHHSSFGCNSFNKSFERRGKFNQNVSGRRSFLHPSFMEDPWAELVKRAEQRKREDREDDGSN